LTKILLLRRAEFKLRVYKSVKILERRIKEGNIARGVDKKSLSQKEFLILKIMTVVYKRLDFNLKLMFCLKVL